MGWVNRGRIVFDAKRDRYLRSPRRDDRLADDLCRHVRPRSIEQSHLDHRVLGKCHALPVRNRADDDTLGRSLRRDGIDAQRQDESE